MKTKIFTLFLALIVGAGTMFADAVKIGDLYYNLYKGNKTAAVTYKSFNAETAQYNEGWDIKTATIPPSVNYNKQEYTVTTIELGAFSDCKSLTSIIIPNSVTSIKYDVFLGCTGLTSIIVENGNPVYDSRDNCNAIIETASNTLINGCKNTIIPNSVTSIRGDAFRECSSLTFITIPNSVTSIGSMAFYGCKGLTNVEIPNSATSIGNCAFSGCTGLTSIIVKNGNPIYDSRDNCNAIIETASNTLISGCKNTIIPNSVTSIGNGAFSDCSSLTSVTIPNSVTSIGGLAFCACTGLTSITIPNSVTSIGDYAFRYCCGLNSIFNYAATPQSIDSEVFGGETEEYEGVQYRPVDKSTCKLYVLQESVSKYRAAKGWKEFKNILAIGAEEVEVTTTKATTTSTTATVAWQQITGAASYELIIRDANGNIICTLIFNAQGLLTSITFNAPARGDAPQKTQTAGFAFTITGLESGATYNYTLTAKNEGGDVLKVESGSFTTKSPQGIDDVEADSKSTKILRDGQVFIQKGEKTFDLQGQELK